jgi:D-alanyl-D-alanine endopeptidase (penicillin-binding protein 7)
LSTSPESRFAVGRRTLQFRNTNGLVRNPAWEIGLQKTGYIVEAGRCLVMQASMAGRKLIMVFLDSTGKNSRIGDAERVRRWIEHDGQLPTTSAAPGSASARKVAPSTGKSSRKRHSTHT